MSVNLQAFCTTCRKTLANSGGTLTLKQELEKIKEGKDKGLRLRYITSNGTRKCKRAGHDIVWEYL